MNIRSTCRFQNPIPLRANPTPNGSAGGDTFDQPLEAEDKVYIRNMTVAGAARGTVVGAMAGFALGFMAGLPVLGTTVGAAALGTADALYTRNQAKQDVQSPARDYVDFYDAV